MKHTHSAETERRIREAALDETLSATFPASDAPSTLPNPDDDSLDAVAQAVRTAPSPDIAPGTAVRNESGTDARDLPGK